MPDSFLPVSSLGLGWSFPPKVDAVVPLDEDIRQSLYILFHTEPGDRIMTPEYGCALRQFLYEKVVTSQLPFLQDVVNKAVLRYEPRILAAPVQIDLAGLADGVVQFKISYLIRATNTQYNLVFARWLCE
jgi:phage baseplate assembly protein W